MTTTMYGSLRGGGSAAFSRAFSFAARAAEMSSRTSDLARGPVSVVERDDDLAVDDFRHLGDLLLELLVVADEITHARLRHELVATLHLVDGPLEREVRLLRIGDDGQKEMRDALVDRELDHLRVDHDHADLFGRGVEEEGADHAVDGHRLAGARRAGDEEVRHACEVDGDRRTGDVLAEAHRELALRLVDALVGEDLLEVHLGALLVRHLDATRAATRDRRDDAHAHRLERHREVVRQ